MLERGDLVAAAGLQAPAGWILLVVGAAPWCVLFRDLMQIVRATLKSTAAVAPVTAS